MTNFFTLHSYLMLNAALVFSYGLIYTLFKFTPLGNALTQKQSLTLARITLIFSIAMFLFAPTWLNKLPIHHASYHFQPFFTRVNATFFQTAVTSLPDAPSQASSFTLPDVKSMLLAVILLGSSLFFMYYLYAMYALVRLVKNAHYTRHLDPVWLVFTDRTTIPFCWSFLNTHYVAIPQGLLENHNDLKLAIRHELQHIRQGDTSWLHLQAILNLLCFWNPCLYAWNKFLAELHEFACDEALILRQKTSRTLYAQCLLDTVSNALPPHPLPQVSLGIIGLSKNYPSILTRRITMLFNYKNKQTHKRALLTAYMLSFLTCTSAVYALDATTPALPLTQLRSIKLVSHHFSAPYINASILQELKSIRETNEGRASMRTSLEQMHQYKPLIVKQLKKKSMPMDLLALPLVESGYNMQTVSPVGAKGIWQIIPSTAKEYGLTVNDQQDDRLDVEKSTTAALELLSAMHHKYHNWKLAVLSYEYGEKITDNLMAQTHSHDAWKLAESASAPKDMKKFLAMFEASAIVMKNPSLVE